MRLAVHVSPPSRLTKLKARETASGTALRRCISTNTSQDLTWFRDGLKQSEVERWMDMFVKARERGLKANADDEQAVYERELRELRAELGELRSNLDSRLDFRIASEPPRR